MALTKVQILNIALMELGHPAISSLDDNNKDALVTAAETAFDFLLPSILSTGNWRFCVTIAQLTQLNVTVPYPWQAAYSLPAGFLKFIRMYPPIYDWDIYNNSIIYTYFVNELMMEYVYQPDVSALPAIFAHYFAYEIAAFLCLSNAQKPEYYAVLESKRVKLQALAHATITQNRPNFSQQRFPVLDNRYIGGLIGNSFNSS